MNFLSKLLAEHFQLVRSVNSVVAKLLYFSIVKLGTVILLLYSKCLPG